MAYRRAGRQGAALGPLQPQRHAMSPTPFFHAPSSAVRFWVLVGDLSIGASVSQQTLHYRFEPMRSDDDPLDTYLAHTTEIHAAVRRRVAAGSIEPVMLREHDLAPASAT